MLALTLVPLVFLYLGNVVFAVHPVGYIQDHLGDVARILAGGVVVAVFFASVGLAVASLTSRRAFAVGGYLALMVVPTTSAECSLERQRRSLPAVDGGGGRAHRGVAGALSQLPDRGNLGPSAWTLTYLVRWRCRCW